MKHVVETVLLRHTVLMNVYNVRFLLHMFILLPESTTSTPYLQIMLEFAAHPCFR